MVIFSPIVVLFILELVARLKYVPSQTNETSLFQYHSQKVFALRPNFSGVFADRNITTNSFGYRDEEFPSSKPNDEVRILALGDSVTYGGYVLSSKTFTEQLEDRLSSQFPSHSFQVINTGVPGNGPMQEYYDLQEGLDFDPDAVILQFTLNDVTEPYIFLKRLGGSGWSYHGIRDIPAIDFYLGQHSSLYCLAKNWYAEMTYRGKDSDTLKERAKKQEIYQKEKLITRHDHEKIREAWKEYFHWLTKIADTCRNKQLPLIILISPFEFQFNLSPEQDYPQKNIIHFCEAGNLSYLDLIDVLRSDFESQGLSYSNRTGTEEFWDRFFYDHDHLSMLGHKFVAELLFPLVVRELGLSP